MFDLLFKRVIRISGFVSKEVREIWRQPRLVLSLLLGPFLILLIFGAGYVGPPAKLNAILVVPNDPSFKSQEATLREQFTKGVNLLDVTTDLAGAQDRLRRREIGRAHV